MIGPDLSRRAFLRNLAVGGSALVLSPALLRSSLLPDSAGELSSKLITRVTRPANLETPVSEFTSWITPNDLFFVRSHFGVPTSWMLRDWKLSITGNVQHPLTLSLAELQSFEEVTLPLVIQCAGNGRALYNPPVPGVQWENGAVGNALWTGVRLRDVLMKAGLGKIGKHIRLQGADRPLRYQTPMFIRSIPIEKAMDPFTLFAYKMNGEPLPRLHGGPLRIVVPGWYGDHCVKWLTHINVQEDEAEGFYMRTAYRIPKNPLPPGTPLNLAESVPLTEMLVKSLIAHPADGARVKRGEMVIQGVAFTGKGRITRVEISTDYGETWADGQIGPEDHPYSWRMWSYVWKPQRPGRYTILSRATDSRGNVQPARPTWNPGGYLWNPFDRIEVRIAG